MTSQYHLWLRRQRQHRPWLEPSCLLPSFSVRCLCALCSSLSGRCRNDPLEAHCCCLFEAHFPVLQAHDPLCLCPDQSLPALLKLRYWDCHPPASQRMMRIGAERLCAAAEAKRTQCCQLFICTLVSSPILCCTHVAPKHGSPALDKRVVIDSTADTLQIRFECSPRFTFALFRGFLEQ